MKAKVSSLVSFFFCAAEELVLSYLAIIILQGYCTWDIDSHELMMHSYESKFTLIEGDVESSLLLAIFPFFSLLCISD